MKKRIVIIGGVAGGASAAARIRRLDEESEIIMFEKGEYISFANCGLPYYVGGKIAKKEKLILQTAGNFSEKFNIEVKVNSQVIGIDREKKQVVVKDLVEGKEYEEAYDQIVLAPGAEPTRPNIKGANGERVYTVRSILDTSKIKDFIRSKKPKNAVVIGAGYVGVEMAENLSKLNVKVVLVEQSSQVITPLDFDMSVELHKHIRSKGVILMLENGVQSIDEKGDKLTVSLDEGTIETDMIIMAIGVKPDTGIAKDAGLELNSKGGIVVNQQMQTSDANIYAVGDAVQVKNYVTGKEEMMPLAGPANKQGRIAADNITGTKSKYEGTQGSSIIKVFEMTAAATGINERTAKKIGIDYEKSFTYSASHAGYYPGAETMAIKIVFEKGTGKILGGQIVGRDGVDKRCDIIATAIRFGATAKDLTRLELCYAPPYSSPKDPVNMAGYAIENIMGGKVKIYHWDQVNALPRDGSVILLDSRSEEEYNGGHIEGYINIPADQVRERLGELDKDKPIYVTCQIGVRGYYTCRILTMNGFDCHNLSGGYRQYKLIYGEL